MNKAKYLGLVFLLPVILYPLKIDHFQDIWIWYYLPFAFCYSVYVWFKPTENISKYIIFTPIAFLIFFISGFTIQIAISEGVNSALEFLPIMLIFAIPFSFVTGLIYVLLALLILKAFESLGYGLKNS
ncbi:hypothetical protein LP316_11715 [Thalassotalea sp. LPB0316]|uniref:hypothetical protein n=1 Tax=Thalassotalea sp. LPB0316 TaxID=2769490 RepID=UPI001865E8D7|nr:hypothetical protein [Thalassotalea sp. LPB0316]QOL24965.1 hypothetical protein LP316_11695 [Thalassotalea sp. LPB0316]QOL24969.1 hypothetical protein LP316_11715 [Thalassotalea sp. LPB0316]